VFAGQKITAILTLILPHCLYTTFPKFAVRMLSERVTLVTLDAYSVRGWMEVFVEKEVTHEKCQIFLLNSEN
jgi:hypothetical protein